MPRIQTLCLVLIVPLVPLLAGCSRKAPSQSGSVAVGADSPTALANRLLTAVKDGDQAALQACFMPGLPDTAWARLQSLLEQKSLAGVEWRVTLQRDLGGGLQDVVVEFAPPVAGEGEPYQNLRVLVAQDTADKGSVMLGQAGATASPAPTGQWVVIVAALVHHYNPG